MAFFQLQPLTAEYLPAVVELDRICFDGLWTLDGYRRELDSPNSDICILIHCRDAMPPLIMGVGCMWAIVDEAHITVLGVRPDYRGQGWGAFLLLALLKLAYDRQLHRATLEVAPSNQAALSLYHKFGFREVGRRRGYYQKTGEDGLILWRGGLQNPVFEKDLKLWEEGVSDRFSKQDLILGMGNLELGIGKS